MFLVGVTGYLKPDDSHIPAIRQQVRNILLFLRDGGDARAETLPGETPSRLKEWLAQRLAPKALDVHLHRCYRHALSQWKPLKNTPIAVMSALAPGADSIVAQEAIDLGMTVIAPMAFPQEHYRNSSSFVWPNATDEENKQRQQIFGDLIKSSHSFPVPLSSDEGLSLDQRDAVAGVDLNAVNDDGTPRRHDRYYAAGEYIASYCHLLLAIWDGELEDSSVGTSAIVLTRLRGPCPGRLSTTSNLALPNGGPVLHLFAPKQTKAPQAKVFDTAGVVAPSMRLLHPFSVVTEHAEMAKTGTLVGLNQHSHERLQRTRLATFARVAFNLERFNSVVIPPWQRRDPDKEFCTKRLVRFNGGVNEKPEPLPSTNSLWKTDLIQNLRRVSDLRCEAADAHSLFAEQTSTTLRWLFRLTMLAAIMLHVFSHWHPQSHSNKGSQATVTHTEPEGGAADAKHSSSQASHESHSDEAHDHESHTSSPVRLWAGLAAFAFAALGLVVFARSSSSGSAEQSDDTRALSEGLRVQFYWNLAGLGRSVSANYMQRQRSELDWIRGAIRAVSIPYHQWADDFSKLSNRQKFEAICCVHGGWIHEQLRFFTNTYHKRHHKLHSWHTTGFVAALTGLFTMAGCWWITSYDPEAVWLLKHRFKVMAWPIAAVATWRLVVWAWTSLRHGRGKPDKHPHHHAKSESSSRRSVIQSWIPERTAGEPTLFYLQRCAEHVPAKAMSYLRHFIEFFAPSYSSSSPPTARPVRLFFHNCVDLISLLPLSIAGAALTMSLAVTLSHGSPARPSPVDLGIIAGGVQLLFGAMAIAWVEKNFDSELSYQYNTMAGLFQHANQHMVLLLSELESCLNRFDANPSAKHQQDFDQVLRRIQGFLYEVGVEALDENAEWLILHRSRPMEPVMAG